MLMEGASREKGIQNTREEGTNTDWLEEVRGIGIQSLGELYLQSLQRRK